MVPVSLWSHRPLPGAGWCVCSHLAVLTLLARLKTPPLVACLLCNISTVLSSQHCHANPETVCCLHESPESSLMHRAPQTQTLTDTGSLLSLKAWKLKLRGCCVAFLMGTRFPEHSRCSGMPSISCTHPQRQRKRADESVAGGGQVSNPPVYTGRGTAWSGAFRLFPQAAF